MVCYYAYALQRQPEQRLLLRIRQRQTLEPFEYNRIWPFAVSRRELTDFLPTPTGKSKNVRYATTTQSFRSIASSATALVRSTVRSTEFICLRIGSNGASRSTFSPGGHHKSLNAILRAGGNNNPKKKKKKR